MAASRELKYFMQVHRILYQYNIQLKIHFLWLWTYV